MKESKAEEVFAKESLKLLVDDLHSKTTYLTWFHLYDLLDDLADYAWANHLQDLQNYEANKKDGLAALKIERKAKKKAKL